mgnify:CR=1 FL=1
MSAFLALQRVLPFGFGGGAAPALAAPVGVEGTVWQDTKPDGVRSTTAPAEGGVQGVTVTLYAADDAVAGTGATGAAARPGQRRVRLDLDRGAGTRGGPSQPGCVGRRPGRASRLR